MTSLVVNQALQPKHDLTSLGGDRAIASEVSLAIDILGAREESKVHPPALSMVDLKVDDILLENANKLIEATIKKMGGIESVRNLIIYNDKNNVPSIISKDKVDGLNEIFTKIKGNGLIGDPKSITYKDVLKINQELIKELIEKKQNPLDFAFIGNTDHVTGNADHVTLDNFCEIFLRDLKSGDSIRILEPGNNDQTTPIVLSSQIKKIEEYCSSRNLTNISVEVLVMGKGGHATTSLFPQIGTMAGTQFSGVEEAVSLSKTLSDALSQNGIKHEFTTLPFTNASHSPFNVQIKLEKESTNTGQNVQMSRQAWATSDKSTKYFVAAATTANGRQLATFAHQIGKDYNEMISLPMLRSEKFIKTAFNDHAAVTEMYAGLAERCRNFLYMYMNFIPLSIADTHNLDNLYEIYANLADKSLEDAKANTPLQVMLQWFGDQFTVMEKSIALNTKLDGHLEKTRFVVQSIMKRFLDSEVTKL